MFEKYKATSNIDVENLIHCYDKLFGYTSKQQVNLLTYDQIEYIDDLSDFLLKNPRNILFYRTEDLIGHWCALFLQNEDIYFFDSYGLFVDDILEKIPNKINKKANQDVFYLSRLLLHEINEGKNVYWNNIKLQGKHPISTCGLWTAFVLGFSPHIKIDNLISKIKKIPNKDDFIVMLSNYIDS